MKQSWIAKYVLWKRWKDYHSEIKKSRATMPLKIIHTNTMEPIQPVSFTGEEFLEIIEKEGMESNFHPHIHQNIMALRKYLIKRYRKKLELICSVWSYLRVCRS